MAGPPREPFLDKVGRTLAEAEELAAIAKEAQARLKAQAKDAKARVKDPRQQAKAARRAHHAERHDHVHNHLWWMRPDRISERKGARDRAEVVAELIEAALRIADEDGFDAVSMRRLATEVGMGTMSLYWYVESKDELLDLVLDHLVGQMHLEPEELTDWRTGLAASLHRERKVFLAHPWMVQVIGQRPTVGPNMLRHYDQSLQLVAGLQLPTDVKMKILHAVDDFVTGNVVRDVADRELARELGMTEREWHESMRPHYEAIVEQEDLSYVGRYLSEHSFEEADVDAFETGLALMLAGIDALIAQHAT
jgi:AcrR family transcriptional regulator